MASDTVVRARIDRDVKAEAAKVLAEMGLSVSDAIRLLLVRVAVKQALPFEAKCRTWIRARRWRSSSVGEGSHSTALLT